MQKLGELHQGWAGVPGCLIFSGTTCRSCQVSVTLNWLIRFAIVRYSGHDRNVLFDGNVGYSGVVKF